MHEAARGNSVSDMMTWQKAPVFSGFRHVCMARWKGSAVARRIEQKSRCGPPPCDCLNSILQHGRAQKRGPDPHSIDDP